MDSNEWKKRAEDYGRQAQRMQSLKAKQRLLAQQQKCMALARAAEKREQADPGASSASPEAAAPIDSARMAAEESARAARQQALAARPEPSDQVKSSPFLMKLWEEGVLSAEELERRAQSIEQLRERFSANPLHADRAANDPDYWNKLYDSRINW